MIDHLNLVLAGTFNIEAGLDGPKGPLGEGGGGSGRPKAADYNCSVIGHFIFPKV